MKKCILFFFFAALSVPVFSQSGYTVAQALDFYRMEKIMQGELNSNLTVSEIQGSPYLNDEFTAGTVFTTSKIQYNDVKLRYNIYSDNIEFEADGQVLTLSTPEIVEKIAVGEYSIHYLPYSISKKVKRGFFILLEEGNASLFLRPEISFEQATLPGAYKDAEPAKFVRKADSYYIRVGLNEAKIVTNRKDLTEIFTTGMDKMDEFIKTEKLKFNREDDLIKIVEFYNSL